MAAALSKVRQAYALAGSPERFEVHHFPRYATPDKRPHDTEPMPEGLHADEYYRRGNTDPPNHFFKGHLAIPWLARTLGVQAPS